jgi:predicted DCC family thiol-disulfide oxidoreductase YuxK
MALTLIYDDGCPICRAIVQFIGRRDPDRQIELVPLSGADPFLRRQRLDPRAARAQVHLIRDDGSVRRGIAVVQPVLAQLAGWRRVAPLLRFWPMPYLLMIGWLLLQQFRHKH